MRFLIDLLNAIAVPHITIQKDGRGGKGRTDVIDGGSRRMKLIIDIPKGTYEAVKVGTINQVLEYKVWNAIKDGTPLDDVKAEIQAKYDSIPWRNNEYDDGWIEALEWVLFSILDNIGKAESED
jgi:hypothetical protein